MTSSPNVSLYELALASEQPPHPLKISPTTFKSIVDSMFEVLAYHDLPVTLWLKLPRDKAWKLSLMDYCKTVSSPPSVYILKNLRPIAEHSKKSFSEADETLLRAKNHVSTHPVSPHSSMVKSQQDVQDADEYDDSGMPLEALNTELRSTIIPLANDSRLKREYFILAIAPNFRFFTLVHRPRSAHQPSLESSIKRASTSYNYSNPSVEDDKERRQPLLGICSFDERTIQNVLNGIRLSIELGCQKTDDPSCGQLILSKWDAMLQQASDSSINPIMLGSLWSRYVHHFESVWSSSANARKQADVASAMQLENEELINALRIKDEFLKTVGQELRTPLSTMKTALSLLSSPSLKPYQKQRYLDLLSQECDRQSALITSVLEFVQLEHVDEQTPMQPLRIIDVVPGVVSTYQPLALEKGVMLAYTIPEDLPAVSCVSNWLRQIVINLLHNGIKFTPEGGQVWVRSRLQGDYVQLEFKDTGIGIAPSDIPKIFNRFYRVRQSSTEESSGAGLGLSIVQQLLLKCGGSISVKSKPGEGSIFNVMIPLYHQDQG